MCHIANVFLITKARKLKQMEPTKFTFYTYYSGLKCNMDRNIVSCYEHVWVDY